MLAIVATIFYAAFAKLSLKAYKEQSQKLKNLLNHTSYGKEILSQRGKQFSPKVVDVFDSSFDQIKEIQQQFSD